MRQTLLALWQLKKPWFISIGALLLLNLIAATGIFLFQRPLLEQKMKLVTEQQKELDAQVRGDTSSVYRNGKRDLEKLQTFIPPKSQFAPLLGEIMGIATECQVSTDSLTYKPDYLKQRNLLLYHVSLSVTGRYSALRCYLYKMQTMKELVVIDTISLKSGDPYKEKVSMTLQLTTYLRDGA